MPKKFGTNTKKEEARERDAQKKKEKKEDEVRKADDSFWKETDEKVNKKLQKEKEKEIKKQETLQRKQENKELVEKEMEEALSKSKAETKGPTRKEIEDNKERTFKRLLEQNKQKSKEEEIEEIDVEKEYINPNYLINTNVTENGKAVIDVSGVEETLNELTMNEFDKHPEKRMRAAWSEYFEKQLPVFKAEYPNSKRSQLIDMMQREFKKSPDNPVYRQQMLQMKK